MDFQAICDSFAAMTCVVSVEKLPNDEYGKICIVAGNQAYIDSIEKPIGDVQMLSQKFVPGSEYTRYLTRDLNFEDYCYQAAVKKKCLHSYAHPERFDVWFNMTFLPLGPDDGNICYCTYTMEINFEPSSQRLSNVSSELASAVLETTIALREAQDFHATMKDVVHDIREIAGGEHCSIMLVDTYEKTCSILAESFDENSPLRNDDESRAEGFYEIASSWEDTIAGSNCLMVNEPHDMNVVKERNPLWYESLQNVGIRTVALFPLKSGRKLLGYMWISNFNPEESTRIKETLELTTFILSSEISNRLLLDRLKVLSSRDMLTGVMNRNEMNNYVDALSKAPDEEAQSIGILFADLNGLKTANDEYGHEAGDRMLKNASRVLCEAFDSESVFRAGGDEFVVIQLGTTLEELEQKEADVREISSRYDDVSFAIGSCYDTDSRNVHQALSTADERMYEDKRKYYEENHLKIRTGLALV